MKVYLAATELGRLHTPHYADYTHDLTGNINQFFSYLNAKQVIQCAGTIPAKSRIVDSGAHSFFTASNISGIAVTAKRKTTASELDPDEYVKQYIKWVQDNYNNFDYFIELDIQDIVGYDKVKQWRKLFDKAGVADKIMYVYHSSNTWGEFQEMVDTVKSRYIGIEGYRSNLPKLPYNRFIKYCYDRKVKIHGFAMIKRKDLLKYPFYSVDSSTWQGVHRFGKVIVFDKNRLVSINNNDKLLLKKYKINVFDSYNQNEQGKKMRITLKSYLDFERFINQLWAKRGITWGNI